MIELPTLRILLSGNLEDQVATEGHAQLVVKIDNQAVVYIKNRMVSES